MKKSPAPSKERDYLLLGTLFLLGLVTAFLLSSYSFNPLEYTPTTERVSTYGHMGYGRGMMYDYGSENRDTCLMDGCLLAENAEYPVEELDEVTIGYLNDALTDERKALATYEAVIGKEGNVRPFINIIRAEEHHISMVKALFDKYGLDIPRDTTRATNIPNSLSDSCTMAVQAEMDNYDLYKSMLPSIKHQDIKEVFSALANASKFMHLPAFEKCSN
ncbi:MAG: hypothetical protein OEX81_05320 [Candidatus Pacebacteria bacterium]|nr:hypothetical protein [Candidatus Paceibacterota bacterium]